MTEQQILALIVGPGGALVLYTLMGWQWFRGKIHSHPEFERSEKNAESWRALYERERDSHQVTRDALAVANERADVAVDAARMANQLIEATQRQALPPGRTTRKPQHGS